MTAPRLMSVCRPNHDTMPAASSRPNTSFVFAAILMPAKISPPNATSTTISPSRPSSSPRIEKMKSVWAFGTYSHF